jgi:hypothetical protein
VDEYSALAQRVAVAVGDLHACLVMSRDGMILGSHPPDDEAAVKPAWLRFAELGQVEKGFVEFADQVWAFVRRGPYAAFAVAGSQVRPGLLIDQLEQALLTAEGSRTRREPLKLPESVPAPSSKPRTSLHPATDQSRAGARAPTEGADRERGTEASSTAGETQPEPELDLEKPAQPHEPEVGDDGSDVDPVLLAKEFSGLLQVPDQPDEGSS